MALLATGSPYTHMRYHVVLIMWPRISLCPVDDTIMTMRSHPAAAWTVAVDSEKRVNWFPPWIHRPLMLTVIQYGQLRLGGVCRLVLIPSPDPNPSLSFLFGDGDIQKENERYATRTLVIRISLAR